MEVDWTCCRGMRGITFIQEDSKTFCLQHQSSSVQVQNGNLQRFSNVFIWKSHTLDRKYNRRRMYSFGQCSETSSLESTVQLMPQLCRTLKISRLSELFPFCVVGGILSVLIPIYSVCTLTKQCTFGVLLLFHRKKYRRVDQVIE